MVYGEKEPRCDFISWYINRGFAWCGTHLYAHDFAPLFGFLFLYSVVWRKITKHAVILD